MDSPTLPIPNGCFNNMPGTVLSNTSSCPLGFYCPNILAGNSSTVPVQCTPSQQCSEQRLLGLNCNDGPSEAYGAQGLYEPVVCLPGYYCATPLQIMPCPEGYFCPTGTHSPFKCDLISICPQGTTTQVSLNGIVAFLVLDFFILIAYYLQRRQLFNKMKAVDDSDDSFSSTPPLPPTPKIVQVGSLDDLVDNHFHFRDQSASVESIITMSHEANHQSSNQSSVSVAIDDSYSQSKTLSKNFQSKMDVKSALASNFKLAMNGKDLRMHFEMDQLGYTLPASSGGKQILQGVTGHIHAGKMTAIMGPSGAGKTTFLNVLCGKVNRTSGTLKISGREAELQAFKKICGFVPQEDVMLRELTVRENILHSARIRAPKTWTPQQIDHHVDSIIEALNLTHAAHTIIGDGITRGISGGQRKRVNIGLEVAATPLCLFLDEPTSGLDSTCSLEVMDLLDQISQIGMTIVAIIHQPRAEIFKKFDEVLMIAPGGRTAYLGPSQGARPYFEGLGYLFPQGSNDADVLMDILSGHGVNQVEKYSLDDLVNLWSLYYQDIVSSTNQVDAATLEKDVEFHEQASLLSQERGAHFLTQVWFAHNLSMVQQFRLFSGLVAEIFVASLAGIVIGMALSGHDEVYIGIYRPPFTLLSPSPKIMIFTQLCMILGVSVALVGAPAGVKTFSEELPVYWRNTASGHSPLAYYLAKTICSIYRVFIGGLHFSGIIYALAKPVTAYWLWFIYITLMFNGVYGLSSIVSMISRRENAALIAVVVCLFSTALCGYGISVNKVVSWNLMWFWNFQFSLYGTEALFSQTLDVYNHIYFSELSNIDFGYTLGRVSYDFVMMALIGILWRVVAYIVMISCNRDRQK